jgi:hypothetical protein
VWLLKPGDSFCFLQRHRFTGIDNVDMLLNISETDLYAETDLKNLACGKSQLDFLASSFLFRKEFASGFMVNLLILEVGN